MAAGRSPAKAGARRARLVPSAAIVLAGSCLLWPASAARGQEPPAAPAPATPLTLPEALELAARYNETPGVAQARIDRSRAIRKEAYATLLPEIELTGIYTRRAREVTREIDGETVVIQARDALTGSTFVDVTLLDARAIPVAKSATRALQAQEFESFDLRRDLAFDVSEAFFAVLGAERLRDAASRRVEVAEATVADAETKLEAGLASRNELTRVELEQATARLSRTEAQNLVVTTRLLLSFLIGAPADRPLAEPDDAGAPVESPEVMTQAAERLRPDLQAAQLRAEALRLLSQEPMLRLVPTLGVLGTYRETNEAGLSGRESDWNIAATVTWELFDGGVRYAQTAARRAEFREAALETHRLRRQVGLEIRRALADLETANAALGEAEVRARVAQQNADEVRVRFGEGLATGLEQADAVVSAFEAEAGLARQRFAQSLAQLSLQRAVGRWPVVAPPPLPEAPPITDTAAVP
jgi:outer membrane protein TolC